MKKTKYYFIFGTDPKYPFQGGWIEVWAVSLNHAIQIFRAKYPDIVPGAVNCADYYTQGQFDLTGMKKDGNRGAYCHEVLGEED